MFPKIFIFIFCSFISVFAETPGVPVLDAVKELVGDYVGHWDTYGFDEQSNIVLIESWDDTISFFDPQIGIDPNINKERAYGNVTMKLVYTFPENKANKPPPEPFKFTEGFKILNDGTAGDHYFTTKYRNVPAFETIETKIGPNLWTIESPILASNYSSLGITKENLLFGNNIRVKTISIQQDVEVQTVTQTTTLVWKDSDGSIRSKQFVSMSGTHRRTLKH